MTQATGRICRGTILALAVLATGCSTFRAGPGRTQKSFGYEGLVGGYVTATEVRSYDGDILQADLWSDTQQSGELLNLDIWPIVGIGIGAFGIRAHVASLGAGLGFLFYNPRPTGGGGTVEVEARVEM
jgi:hypothetical protein